ncbi:MAG: hypothetical protein ACOYYS_22305 [Chloroflexota bacterium]
MDEVSFHQANDAEDARQQTGTGHAGIVGAAAARQRFIVFV